MWKIACQEAQGYKGRYEQTSLEFEDLVGCALERMVTRLAAGELNCDAHLRNWARDGIGRALHNEVNRPQPIGLI